MAKFMLEIELGNALAETADDVAEMLYRTADKLIDYTGSDPLVEHINVFANIRDLNGNTVGLWQVKELDNA